MGRRKKRPNFRVKSIIILSAAAGVLVAGTVFGISIKGDRSILPDAADSAIDELGRLAVIQDNSLKSIAHPVFVSSKTIGTIKMVVTAYSSTPWETDSDPFITASGSGVKEGIVANNLLAFGTKVRIPELYGDRIFVVEDRMHWRKSDYHLDIWFPSYWQAQNFGAKTAYIEILEN